MYANIYIYVYIFTVQPTQCLFRCSIALAPKTLCFSKRSFVRKKKKTRNNFWVKKVINHIGI